MEVIIIIALQFVMLGLCSSLFDWMENTPVRKKKRRIKTVDDIHDTISKL